MKLPELEELYRRYRMDLYRYLCFLTHDPVQAEDLLSETFVRVIKRLPTFRGECEVKTWLFGIARNIWLESLRRRHQSVSLDDLMERYITDDALTETTAARQKLRRVQALLQQKDERTRSVVYLRAQGYSYQEIAQKLQITEASARVVEAPYPRLAESNPAKGGIRRMTQEKETNRRAEQGKAETEIPCAVCRDLIPLVQDGVASPESEALVKAHLQTCPECRTLWQAGGGQALPQSLPAPDDARLLQKIRHKFNTGLLMFAALGMGFGVLTSYGEHSNWIILIFPFVCAAAVYQDPQMWKLLLAVGEGIALCALLRTFVRYWQYGATLMEYPVTLIVYSVFMLGLCGVGCLIGWLLNYASGKGEKKHESEK